MVTEPEDLLRPLELHLFDKAKAKWAPGPWQTEPDRKQWAAAADSLPCLILRDRYFGHLCGYVACDGANPIHGKSYKTDMVRKLVVHGGVTFSGERTNIGNHQLDDELPGLMWWLGFDCAHVHDTVPHLTLDDPVRAGVIVARAVAELVVPDEPAPNGLSFPTNLVHPAPATYRTIDFVIEQCEKLALQIVEQGKVS